jgi:membrane protein
MISSERFLGREAIQGQVFWEINGLIGNEAAAQIQEVIKTLHYLAKPLFSIVGSVTLLIERLPFWRNQDSINIIWI